ncbi:lysine methyltransferase SMYD2 [Seminavis robusta]|uniref:Lysine methyltransferase SMYD2 n=1 Tax=Seminavis robusta TaxID=568900 RepID=A0A9N8H400_9STRA|nr:lysine methyltransferase SMYD2 [Seminavis robusta]|eukprot:Sro101_g051480.1 lysine methyltransferase SMYD2 (575) ;mRNA; f:21952-23676
MDPPPLIQATICDCCGKAKHPDKDLLKCGRCRQACYHDKVCQKKHWPTHKAICRQLVQRAEEEALQRQSVQVLPDTDNKGRVLIALKEFAPGDVVLLESPAVLFDTRLEYRGLLQAFGSATVHTQQRVLDLHASPHATIDSPARQQCWARLEQQRVAYLQAHPQASTVLTQNTAEKLLAIIETNGYNLFNAAATTTNDPKQWMGLFVLGSMPEHSCNPNVTLNTTRDCKIELLAERSIAKGDRLSFSYIEGIYEKCREQRQASLLEQKHFTCLCARCFGIDECRPLLLPGMTDPIFWNAQLHKYVGVKALSSSEADNDDNAPSSMTLLDLTNEDASVASFLKAEEELMLKIHQLEQSMEQGKISFQSVLTQMASLMSSTQWKSTIHPLHWLNLSACNFLSQAGSATARMQPASDGAMRWLRVSIVALLHNLTWVERTVRVLRHQPTNNNGASQTLTTAAVCHNLAQEIQNHDNPVRQIITHILFDNDVDVKRAVGIVCAQPVDETCVTADSLLTAFFAGQDLLVAGHADLAIMLYQRYQEWFHKLKQPNEENRQRIDVLISSRGNTNPFANMLL